MSVKETAGKTIAVSAWRTPLVIIICGCLIGAIGFGPRAALGLFLTPMWSAFSWGRDVFALALAIQVLIWGAATPFAGAIADRFGSLRVLSIGAVLYCSGLVLMSFSTTTGMLDLSAGVLTGLGIAGTSFTLVLAAFSKLMPAEWRGFAFGIGTAAGSFGQFLFSPLAVALLSNVGWHQTLLAFAVLVWLVLPLAFVVATPAMDMGVGAVKRPQSFREALGEAFGHQSYVLLVL